MCSGFWFFVILFAAAIATLKLPFWLILLRIYLDARDVRLRSPGTVSATTAEPDVSYAVIDLEAISEEAEQADPSERLPEGARRDPLLGLVYDRKPAETDDLTAIKGVGEVLEQKLHAAGIYTYAQIALWDDQAEEAFAEKLAFKGRSQREGWREQCLHLYEAKYGTPVR